VLTVKRGRRDFSKWCGCGKTIRKPVQGVGKPPFSTQTTIKEGEKMSTTPHQGVSTVEGDLGKTRSEINSQEGDQMLPRIGRGDTRWGPRKRGV